MRGPNFTAPTRTCLPVKFLTKFSCRPGSRFLPFSAQRFKQKHRSAFQVWTHTKQLVCLDAKKPTLARRLLNTAPTRTCLPVKFLTKFSCRPGSRFLPFSAQRFKQKHRSAFQVWTHTKQLVCLDAKKPTLARRLLNTAPTRT